MVNTDSFIKKLEEILDFYSLSASAFADKLNVQRSGLSHLLSGRNNPSLDFVLKIVENFPEVDLYWLLLGKGSFPKSDLENTPPPANNNSTISNSKQDLFSEPVLLENNDDAVINTPQNISSDKISQTDQNFEIERIVIFYKNGTFKNYLP
ncbi:helix-turn-helix domain-containing protein [Flavobacterium rhizosphaerae]|uniref:Helix-turn-helix transcriptional regulator n=1 Tax=Flavobacterium rhizosphaerae TaxID=3163298 RepID=A0ABW8YY99_9FLAO